MKAYKFLSVILLTLIMCLTECGREESKDTTVSILDTDAVDVVPDQKEVSSDIFQEILSDIMEWEDVKEVQEEFQEETNEEIEIIQEIFDTSEVIAPLKTGYRIINLEVMEPGFCYSYNDTCVDITATVNDMLNDSINYCSNPVDTAELNIAAVFTNFGSEFNPSINLSFGNAICNCAEGNISGCMLDPEAFPVNYGKITYKSIIMSSTCYDNPQITPECFVTPEKDMALEIMGAIFGFKKAVITGHFDQAFQENDKITGFITGFMPEQLAKQILIIIPNPYLDPPEFEIPLDKLLPFEKKTYLEGKTGWNFFINFKAKDIILFTPKDF